MNEQKITIWILGAAAVLFVLGLGVWFLIRPSQSTAPPATPEPPQSQPTTGGSSQSVSVPPQTQRGGGTLPNLEQEYQLLFAKLSAQRIEFQRVDAASVELQGVYALYKEDIDAYKVLFPDQSDLSIAVTEVDLSGDGAVEVLAVEDFPGFCGTAGCPLDILVKDGDGWERILSVISQGEVGLSGTRTNGYSNLFFTLSDELSDQTRVLEYAWINEQYQPLSIVAQWDGATFQLVQ